MSVFTINLLSCLALPLAAQEPSFDKKTYVYKEVDGVKVQADVYRADDDKVRPVLVWLHGGALIVGSRKTVPRKLLELCRKEGYVLVSFDYRLAPEVKLPAIIADVKDAFRWLPRKGQSCSHRSGSPGRGRRLGGGLFDLDDRNRRQAETESPGRLLGLRRRGRRLVHQAFGALPEAATDQQGGSLQGLGDKVLTGHRRETAGKARGRYYRYLHRTACGPRR